ncbi:MAG: tRNA lysidine(34) synthetase TilS [Burkholderiaceae bacterium]|nr:MAG: tRNA lysidine(34) synthetase TilS [Burkholderiaceae bacterium]
MSLNSTEMIAAFERRFFSQLGKFLADVGEQGPIAVAYSGGLDSSVLLHLLAKSLRSQHFPFFAIHIHHGLSPNANAWLAHCQTQCSKLEVPLEIERVLVESSGQGIEAAARRERYNAIGKVCMRLNSRLVLTAHHLDDQAETVMMQLMRGSGVRGLAGIDSSNHAPTLLGSADIRIARLLLNEARSTLEAYAHFYELMNIEDESNQNTKFVRNALRLVVMPQLEELAPNFAERVARTASHMRESKLLLEELAADDLARAEHADDGLSLDVLNTLSQLRLKNAFRYWLSKKQVQLPSSAKLEEMLGQLMEAREDARIQIYHDGVMLSRYQDRLFIVKNRSPQSQRLDLVPARTFVWLGEESLSIPGFAGRLLFRESDTGMTIDELRGRPLECKRRPHGVRLRLAANRPSRDIKSHFQSAGIPFWRRDQLPFIYLSDRLLFVGELGMDAAFIDVTPGPKISLEWQAD